MRQIVRPIARAGIASREKEVIGRVEIGGYLWEVEHEWEETENMVVMTMGEENALEMGTTHEDLLAHIVALVSWVDEYSIVGYFIMEEVAVGREWADAVYVQGDHKDSPFSCH